MNTSDEKFDRALERYLQSGELDPELQPHSEALRRLQALEQVPDRKPARALAMRHEYFEQVSALAPAVSISRDERHKGWMSIFRKERSPMFAIARIITIVAILLGGTAGTALAAQDSLPDQALYPVKTLVEDLRLELTSDPQTEFDLLMMFIEKRFAEIQTMLQNGETVGERVQLRLQQQLQSAFKYAAELDDPDLLRAMEQIRERSQIQEYLFDQLQNGYGSGSPGDLNLAHQAVIRSRIQAEGALEDPNTLRTRYGAERNEAAPDQPEVIPGERQGGLGDGAGEDEGTGPTGPGEDNSGTPGSRRNGKSQ